MPADPLSDDLNELAKRLKQLLPAGQLDRDRVMYLAGQQSAVTARPRRGGWLWPAATGLASTVAVTLGVLLTIRPDAVNGPTAVGPHEVRDASTPLTDEVEGPNSHSRLRRELLTGVWRGESGGAAYSGSGETLRPRDFGILSRDGLRL